MENLTIDLKTTAVVVIDLQKGIAEREGLAPLSGWDVIERNNELLASLKNTDALIALVRVKNQGTEGFFPVTDNQITSKAPFPVEMTEFSTAITNDADAENVITIDKHNWGAFYGTDLDVQLRRRGIKTIILTGIATSIGVDTTAREAAQAGYDLILVSDAMTDVNAIAHQSTLDYIFPRLGKVRSLAEVQAVIDQAK